jgi:hypothetical protein
MSPMELPHERLMRLIAEERKRQRLERPVDMMRASGLSKSTVHRLDTGQPLGESALRAISKALGWTADSAEEVLAGGDPTIADPPEESLEARYHREPLVEGALVGLVEDMIYEAFIAAAPDTPLSKIDEARRAAFEVLRRNGIEVAKKHPEASQGTDTSA